MRSGGRGVKEVKIDMGALRKSIKTQLGEQGFEIEKPEFYEKILDAWNILRIHGFLSGVESKKSGQRIMKAISTKVKHIENWKICEVCGNFHPSVKSRIDPYIKYIDDEEVERLLCDDCYWDSMDSI
jgi:hypothetical protein